MSIAAIEYKRGTYFSFLGTTRDPRTKLVVPLPVGTTLQAQLRKFVAGRPVMGADGLVAQLDGVIISAALGQYRISADQTAAGAWPLGATCTDLVFVYPTGERVPTKGYVRIDIVESATQAPAP